jgi:hypothetical protein
MGVSQKITLFFKWKGTRSFLFKWKKSSFFFELKTNQMEYELNMLMKEIKIIYKENTTLAEHPLLSDQLYKCSVFVPVLCVSDFAAVHCVTCSTCWLVCQLHQGLKSAVLSLSVKIMSSREIGV